MSKSSVKIPWQLSVIALYFGLLLFIAPVNLLSFDTYYYWDWSRHLDWSYFDGAPMIAYWIAAATMLLGSNLFALSMIGVVSTAVICWLLFTSARFFLTSATSFNVVLLWLFSPLVTLDLLKQTTYDTPLNLFWALTIYFCAKFIKFSKTQDLYGIGLSIGLMLLSKYPGIVLVLGLFTFIISSPYRYLLQSLHLYAALGLALAIFSPVIYWNFQHDWLSFLYQLHTHQITKYVNPYLNIIKMIFLVIIPFLNFMLIPPPLSWYKLKGSLRGSKKQFFHLCLTISAVFIAFYLLAAPKATIKGCWLSPFLLTAALLAGFCLEAIDLQKKYLYLITCYIIISVAIILNNTTFFNVVSKKIVAYKSIKAFNHAHPQLPKAVFTAGWMEARMLFFLRDKPFIYTLNMGEPENQYAIWSKPLIAAIKNKQLANIWFIDLVDRKTDLAKWFDTCLRLDPTTVAVGRRQYALFAYQCSNSTKNPP